MEYHGNLYAKVGGEYFKLDETSDDIDNLRDENDNLKLELSKYEKRYPSKMDLPEPYDLIVSDRGIPYKVKEGFKITNLLSNSIENINSLEWWRYCL